MSLSAALEKDYTGLIDRDIPGFREAERVIMLWLEVSGSPAPCDTVGFIGCIVAWISIELLHGGLTNMMLSA